MKNKFFSLCFVIAVTIPLVYSARGGLSVYSALDRDTISLNQEATLRLTVAGAGYFPPPELPEIPNFSIHKTGQYTKVDFTKFAPIPYTVFEYILIPKKKGSFKIPSIYVKYKGYYYFSKELTLNVVEKAEPVRDVRTELIKGTSYLSRFIEKPLFVTSKISTTKALYNQQLVYTYTIYTRVPLIRLPKEIFPDYEAFHREPLHYRRIYSVDIDGVYYKAIQRKCALFPYMTDDHKVDGITIRWDRSCFPKEVLENSDISEHFKTNKYLYNKSRNINVNVTHLPLKDKPLSFSGLIGVFDIIAETDKKTVALN
ncbi:BatD family protein, partial [bacterium]